MVYGLNLDSSFAWCYKFSFFGASLTSLGLLFSCHMFSFSVLYRVVMHNCCWDQPKPIHMHWKIHGRLIPSSRPHEDGSCVDLGVPFLWERGTQFPCRPWHASGRDRHDLVWECIVETWRQRAPGLQHTEWENSEAWGTVIAIRARSEGLKWDTQRHPVLVEHWSTWFYFLILFSREMFL